MLPTDLLREVAGYLAIDDIRSLHLSSRELRERTVGIISRRNYHNWMGGRLWQLEAEQEGLDRSYRQFKCKGRYTRANVHRDFEVYDKCIRINNSWRPGHLFTELKGAMDSVADVEKMPIEVEGFKGSDNYYRREGIAPDEPLPISEGPMFTEDDLNLILGWLKRLHVIALEVLGEATKISTKHDFYKMYPRPINSIAKTVQRRIDWLEGMKTAS